LVVGEPEGDYMTEVSQKQKRWLRWAWPSLLAAGVGGAAMFLFRGCWHSKVGWPMREGDHSYQVCLGCGIKRLFDEKKFRGYGPYGYDVKELIAREQAARARQQRKPA
jgi:hypothetical protein